MIPTHPGLIFDVIDGRRSFFVEPPRAFQQPRPLSAWLRAVTGDAPFMVAPIIANARAIGCFYADRQPRGGPVSEKDYQGFLHFVQQASLGLEHIAARGQKKV